MCYNLMRTRKVMMRPKITDRLFDQGSGSPKLLVENVLSKPMIAQIYHNDRNQARSRLPGQRRVVQGVSV